MKNKTTTQAKNQASKILTYNMELSKKLREQAQKIERKPYTKNLQLHLKRSAQVKELYDKSEMYENRGQMAWGLFLKNPNYYGWLRECNN